MTRMASCHVILSERRGPVAGAAKLRTRHRVDKQEAIQATSEESMYLIRNA
jgi:hypothetical protein